MNSWVLETVGVKRSLLELARKRKIIYFGHVMRKDGDCLEKEIILGTIPVMQSRDKQKTTWISNDYILDQTRNGISAL